MEKDKDILKQVGRDTGMRVPDGYFEGFTSRMVSQLDNFEVVELEKPTVWQRVRPWLYMGGNVCRNSFDGAFVCSGKRLFFCRGGNGSFNNK